jgi:hypothetical protein
MAVECTAPTILNRVADPLAIMGHSVSCGPQTVLPVELDQNQYIIVLSMKNDPYDVQSV